MVNINKCTKFNHTRKERIVKIMGNKCVLCGYNRSLPGLEIHHINKDEKEFSFSDYRNYKNWDKLLNELKKCILLCSVCHKEIHYTDLYKDIKLSSSYNEKIAEELTDEIFKPKKESFCKKCNKKISYRANLCSDCYSKNNRKIIRPSRKNLKNLIRNTSFVSIGKQFNVSDKTVSKWCKYYNLPFKKSEINKITDDDWKDI